MSRGPSSLQRTMGKARHEPRHPLPSQMPSEAEIRDFTACITELVQLWSCISIQALDTVPLLRVRGGPRG